MRVSDIVKKIIDEQGRTQVWVAYKMNEADPSLDMDKNKLSAITTGRRQMSGDELLAFCKAIEISPDVFLNENDS